MSLHRIADHADPLLVLGLFATFWSSLASLPIVTVWGLGVGTVAGVAALSREVRSWIERAEKRKTPPDA
jgi:uncharacterized membrane protein